MADTLGSGFSTQALQRYRRWFQQHQATHGVSPPSDAQSAFLSAQMSDERAKAAEARTQARADKQLGLQEKSLALGESQWNQQFAFDKEKFAEQARLTQLGIDQAASAAKTAGITQAVMGGLGLISDLPTILKGAGAGADALEKAWNWGKSTLGLADDAKDTFTSLFGAGKLFDFADVGSLNVDAFNVGDLAGVPEASADIASLAASSGGLGAETATSLGTTSATGGAAAGAPSGITVAGEAAGGAVLAAAHGLANYELGKAVVNIGEDSKAGDIGGAVGATFMIPGLSALGRAAGGAVSELLGRGRGTKDEQVSLRTPNREAYTKWGEKLNAGSFGGDPILEGIARGVMTTTGKKQGAHPFSQDKVPDYFALSLQKLPTPNDVAQWVAALRAGDTKYKPNFDPNLVAWLYKHGTGKDLA